MKLTGATVESTGKRQISIKMSLDRQNNFDLLRLLAATQVAFYHGWKILHLPLPHGWLAWFWDFGMFLPGVPIFFCISGFLIPQSLERNRNRLGNYAEARILRIYPALIAVTCFGTVMLCVLGFFKDIPLWKCASWFFSTLAIGSTANPQFLRGFGSGVWNGSLWTISVEISFYVILPLAYLLFDYRKHLLNVVFVIGAILSFSLFLAFDGLSWGQTSSATALTKIVWFSIGGNLWMFLLGTLAHRYFTQVHRLFEGRFAVWFLLLAILACVPVTDWPAWARAIHLFCARALLAGTTLAAAFSWRHLSERILRGQDLSYGLYLVHAPIFNFLCHLGLNSSYRWYLTGLGLSCGTAALSWITIEKPALALKGRFFKRIFKYLFPSIRLAQFAVRGVVRQRKEC